MLRSLILRFGLAVACIGALASFALASDYSGSRSITVRHQSLGFYISFRCYDHRGDSVGGWHTNVSYGLSRTCTASDEDAPSFVRINRKDLWFRNVGSTWRPSFSQHCLNYRAMCITVGGPDLSSSRYSVDCGSCPLY